MTVRLRVYAAFTLALALAISAAHAQNVILDAPGLFPKKKDAAPVPQAAPLAWPRLDPGATLCRSESSLDELAAYRAEGNRAAPPGCRRIAFPTAIEIIGREGPGRTQIRVSGGSGETGWTDAWLPSRAPTTATSVAVPIR